jgi:hypothetical protein
MSACSYGRIPRAHVDPIGSAADAMRVFSVQMERPMRYETLVMFLDADSRGISLVTITDTTDAAQVLGVVEAMAMTAAQLPQIEGFVVVSVRPGGCLLPGDGERWLRSVDIADDNGSRLIDWLIVGRDGTISPREAGGLASRWPGAA